MESSPRVLLLDGDYPTALSIAKELSVDLGATIVGAGSSRHSRLLRSNYCDVPVTVPPTDANGYADAVRSVVTRHRPQFVLPVGYGSAAALQPERDRLPSFASLCLPDRESFRIAVDKARTMEQAADLGIDVPADYTEFVADCRADGNRGRALERLDFPVFLKARRETGGGYESTARVERPSRFWRTYDRIATATPTDEVLVQECITGSDSTFGCGVLFLDGRVDFLFGHEELRSVPRYGGSGTHLRIRRDPDLEAGAIELLQRIGWNGVALVEFKRRADGRPVLMEINPKFWASYALASRFGYRFASRMVAHALGLEAEPPFASPKQTGEMVFPLRELDYYARNRDDERLLDSLSTIARPGRAWSVDRSDLRGWLTPPVDLVGRLPVEPGRQQSKP